MANGGPEASPLRPRRRAGSRDPFLIVCSFFGVVTAAAALLCVAANVLSAVYSFRGGADVRNLTDTPSVLLITGRPSG